MTIQLYYKTKKELKNNIGSELDYSETNMFKDEYTENPKLEEGSIIVFPSFLQHRVAPITKGIRYSLVAWFLGPPFI